jgi:hypothetical protein
MRNEIVGVVAMFFVCLFVMLWEKEREVVGIGEVCVQFNFVCLCGWKRKERLLL